MLELLKAILVRGKNDKFVGVLNCRAVCHLLRAEVLERQQKADNIRSGRGI